jgi:hypothetical protein
MNTNVEGSGMCCAKHRALRRIPIPEEHCIVRTEPTPTDSGHGLPFAS